jgi:hypothetical protein
MSDNGSNIEVFTAEYRHEVVEKFVRDLISGHIQLFFPNDMDSDHGRYIIDRYTTIKDNIVKYVSGKLDASERDSIETSLFSEIVYFRILGITRDKKPDFQIKHEMDILNKKIDSTNKLLYKVLVILNGLIPKK